jgi:AbrB family looped-hinge helix DNA binding protein
MQTVSITPKWQVHIPVAVRKKLKLDKPTQVDVSVHKNKIVLKPKKSKIFELEGSLKGIKPTKPINIDKIRDYIDYSEL